MYCCLLSALTDVFSSVRTLTSWMSLSYNAERVTASVAKTATTRKRKSTIGARLMLPLFWISSSGIRLIRKSSQEFIKNFKDLFASFHISLLSHVHAHCLRRLL